MQFGNIHVWVDGLTNRREVILQSGLRLGKEDKMIEINKYHGKL